MKNMVRKIGSILLLCSVFTGYSEIINGIRNVRQQYDQWCWAGASWIIIDYYGGDTNGNPVQQCDIAEYARIHSELDYGTVLCCDTTNSSWKCNYWNYNYGPDSGSIKMILIDITGIENYGINRSLTGNEAERECSAGRPFVIRIDNPGHFVVGYGIENGFLYYSDPWSGFCVEKYGNTLQGNRIWTHTNVLTTDPPWKCVVPKNLELVNSTENSLTLSWSNVSSAIRYDIQYREDTTSSWILVNDISELQTTISNLHIAKEYEVQIRSVCSEELQWISSWSGSYYFSTKGCDIPQNTKIEIVSKNSVKISWDPCPFASGYVMHFKTAPSSIWDDIVMTNAFVTLDNLPEGTSFNYRIRSICESIDGQSVWGTVGEFKTPGAYSESRGGEGLFIETVRIDSKLSISGQSDYTDNTISGVPFYVQPGDETSYSFEAGEHKSGYFMAWIDWNKDYIFSSDEQICKIGPVISVTGPLKVPSGVSGITRLRVSLKAGTAQSGADEIFTSGEVEDYSIVVGDVACAVPADVRVNYASADQFKVSWQLNSQIKSYEIRYKQVDKYDWDTLQSSAAERVISGSFTAGANYEVQVRAICITGISEYSASVIFTPDLTVHSIGMHSQVNLLTINIPGQRKMVFPLKEQPDKEKRLDILTIDGKKVFSKLISGNNNFVNTHALSNGLYIIQLKEKKSQTVKATAISR